MFKHLSLSCVLLTTIAATSVWAAPKAKAGNISNVVPDAFKSAKSCADDADWKPAKFNQKFDPKDCFKTHDGGSVELQLKSDNSKLTIGENSIVSVDSLVEDDGNGNFVIRPKIQKGFLGFNVEKNKGNKVDFSTGTAAASIRGTEGFIGGNDNVFFGSLKHGSLAIQPNNAENSNDELVIGGGETALGKGKFTTVKLKSSGDMGFAKIMNKLAEDSTLTLDDLVAAAISADEAYQKSLAADSAAQAPADTAKKENAEEATAMKVPQVKYSSYDSLRCVANVTVSNVQGEVRLSTVVDGTPAAEVGVKRNMSKRLSLRSGVHEYEFMVQNDAGRNSVKKTLGCYPMKSFSVKVLGGKYVVIPLPPKPPIAGISDVITETLQFQIRIPENDVSFLNKVTVRQSGKVLLQERLSQIQNLDYQIPVELKRGKNRFDIEVIHKSGFAVKTYKVYEVK